MKKWFVRLKNLESGDEVLVSGTGKTPKDLVDLEIQTKGKEAKIFVEATLRSLRNDGYVCPYYKNTKGERDLYNWLLVFTPWVVAETNVPKPKIVLIREYTYDENDVPRECDLEKVVTPFDEEANDWPFSP